MGRALPQLPLRRHGLWPHLRKLDINIVIIFLILSSCYRRLRIPLPRVSPVRTRSMGRALPQLPVRRHQLWTHLRKLDINIIVFFLILSASYWCIRLPLPRFSPVRTRSMGRTLSQLPLRRHRSWPHLRKLDINIIKIFLFSAPVTGVYVFHYHVLAQYAQEAWVELYHNYLYVDTAYGHTSGSYGVGSNAAAIELQQGDTVFLDIKHHDSYLYGAQDEVYCTFTGYLIKPTSTVHPVVGK